MTRREAHQSPRSLTRLALWRPVRSVLAVRRRLLVARNLYLRRGFDRRVDFLIAGAMRGGTSALYDYARQHPEICFAERKEVSFFDHEPFAPDPDYRRYHAWFKPNARHKRLAEATPYYVSAPAAPQRIHDYNPAMKIVVILRNPIDRAYSHWNKHVQQGREHRAFSQVVDDYLAAGLDTESYLRLGFYAGQLENLWRSFSHEQTLLLRNEELLRQPDETLDRFFRFVDVAPFHCRRLRGGFRTYAAPMSETDRQRLHQVYDDEIRAVAQLTGWNCDAWLETAASYSPAPTSRA